MVYLCYCESQHSQCWTVRSTQYHDHQYIQENDDMATKKAAAKKAAAATARPTNAARIAGNLITVDGVSSSVAEFIFKTIRDGRAGDVAERAASIQVRSWIQWGSMKGMSAEGNKHLFGDGSNGTVAPSFLLVELVVTDRKVGRQKVAKTASYFGIAKRNSSEDKWDYERGMRLAIARALRGQCREVGSAS